MIGPRRPVTLKCSTPCGAASRLGLGPRSARPASTTARISGPPPRASAGDSPRQPMAQWREPAAALLAPGGVAQLDPQLGLEVR